LKLRIKRELVDYQETEIAVARNVDHLRLTATIYFNFMVVQDDTSSRGSSEKVGRRGREDWGGGLPPPQFWESGGFTPGKIFGNMGANMCNFGAFVGKKY